MKFKKAIVSLLVILFACMSIMLCGCKIFHKNNVDQNVQPQQLIGYAKYQDKLWCITFQIVWDEFRNTLLSGRKVEFIEGNPPIADELNRGIYSKDVVSPDSYYIKSAKLTPELKHEIEKDIYDKFHEKSDVLHLIDWDMPRAYLFYTMLIKNFTFNTVFDELKSEPFNQSADKVKYFGIDKKSNEQLYKNVTVLFYDDNEYAIRLNTNENEYVIVYKTDKNDSFDNLYEYVVKNSKVNRFTKYDTFKMPEIIVDETISYDELSDKPIKYTDYVIATALQTIKFKLNKKGGSLKSEAVIVAKLNAVYNPNIPPERHFDFDKPFVLFLQEKGKDKPYYAMKVSDLRYLVKD